MGIEHLLAGDGVDAIDALDGTLFVLVGLAPGDGLRPVEVGRDGFAVLVLLDLEVLVATICRVGEAFADDGVAHIVHKLAVHGIRNLFLVHPEGIYGDSLGIEQIAPERVLALGTHFHRAALDEYHAVGLWFVPGTSAHTRDFAALSAHRLHAAGQHRAAYDGHNDCQKDFLHISVFVVFVVRIGLKSAIRGSGWTWCPSILSCRGRCASCRWPVSRGNHHLQILSVRWGCRRHNPVARGLCRHLP